MSAYQPGIYIVRQQEYARDIYGPISVLRLWQHDLYDQRHWRMLGSDIDGGNQPDGIISGPFTVEQILATMTAHLCDSCRELVRIKMEQTWNDTTE